MFSGNDPWNPVGASSVNQSNSNQLDTFSGLQTNMSSGLNGRSNITSKINNDPWTTHTQASDGPHEGQSMDPFSPVAQSQLAEFDILRDQMENPSTTTGIGSESNNGGKVKFVI